MKKSPFGFDKPEDSPGFLLWQTTIIWQRQIKISLDPYDLSHAQFVILATTCWHQHQNLKVTQGLIVNLSKLDKMTVSKSLKKLENKGYAKRIECKEDTRAKLVILTKKGMDLVTQLIPVVEKIDADFFGILNKAHQKMLISHLSSLASSAV